MASQADSNPNALTSTGSMDHTQGKYNFLLDLFQLSMLLVYLDVVNCIDIVVMLNVT